jgi:hypothetical protein
MVSSTPAGSGLPIGLMPGALPSDHASRQTLNTTAMRLPFGHSQFGLFCIDGSADKTARIGTEFNHRMVRRVEPFTRDDQACPPRGLMNQAPPTTNSASTPGAMASQRLAAATAAVAAQPIDENASAKVATRDET